MPVTNQKNEIIQGGEATLHEGETRTKNLKIDGPHTNNGNFEELRSFAEDTTLHGARFLFSDSFFRRLVWLGMILACFSFCVHQAYICLKEYSLYPFNTKMATNFSTDGSQLPFPAVTLCNLNPFNTRRYRRYLGGNYSESEIERQIQDISLLTTRSDDITKEDFKKRNGGLFYRPNTANETNPHAMKFSHQIEDMLLTKGHQLHPCSINGKKCEANSFTSFFNPLFKKCYTFNTAKSGSSVLNASFAGQQSGLKLRLNIERESYLPNLMWPSVGIVILIHDQDSFPIIEEFGVAVPPGMSTMCAIRRRNLFSIGMFAKNQRDEISTGIETNQHEGETRIKNLQTDRPNTSDGNFEELRSFALETTLHGVRFLFSDGFFRRLVWLGIITACFGFCIYQTYICLWQYSRYPFNTKMTTNFGEDGRQLPFPAVTLCNFNTFNTRRFRQIVAKGALDESQIERQIADIAIMSTRSDDVLKEDFAKRNSWLTYRPKMANQTNSHVLRNSHQMEDMLLPNGDLFYSCSINGKKCDANNFTSFLSPLYAKCYTFNAAKKGKPSLSAPFVGQHSGLKLRLNIERESYLPNLVWPSVGIVILIHDQNSFPIVEEFGIAVPPGISTACAIRRRNITNLPHPYNTKCKEGTLEAFNDASQIAYRKQACLVKCRNNYTIKTCNCTPTRFKADPGVPFCTPIEEATCVYKSIEEFGDSDERKMCEKECPEPCNQIEYKTSFSYGGLQREALLQHLMSFLNGTKKSSADRSIYEPLLNMTKAEREKYIDDNIISLDIYFEDLSVDIITQTPLYEPWALIGDLGGTFGLFMGMSCLTLFEFVDFAFRKFARLAKGGRGKRAVNVQY